MAELRWTGSFHSDRRISVMILTNEDSLRRETESVYGVADFARKVEEAKTHDVVLLF